MAALKASNAKLAALSFDHMQPSIHSSSVKPVAGHWSAGCRSVVSLPPEVSHKQVNLDKPIKGSLPEYEPAKTITPPLSVNSGVESNDDWEQVPGPLIRALKQLMSI